MRQVESACPYSIRRDRWLCKGLALRYSGMTLSHRSLPFFLGLILGDFLNGGFWTLLGCFAPIHIYPING